MTISTAEGASQSGQFDNEIRVLIDTVQHNCHIADARHAGDYTLCVYLLKMREMYRWEQGLPFSNVLTKEDVGDWLTRREGVWDEAEEEDYHPLTVNGKTYDAFDNELITPLLQEKQFIYNAGLGIRCRPHFFIAELEQQMHHDEYTVYISGKEYARDMAAPAAMAQGNKIFIRRESLRRVIWEILDDARVQGLDNPLTRAMRFYDFDNDVEQALDRMTEVELDNVVQHEVGEVQAGQYLGEDWNEMVTTLAKTQAEIMLRAIRDHIADSMTTLPILIQKYLQNQGTNQDSNKNYSEASLHFYFGNMTAMRKHLAPGLLVAYKKWHETGRIDALQEIASCALMHWQTLAAEVMAIYKGADSAGAIEALIESRKLT